MVIFEATFSTIYLLICIRCFIYFLSFVYFVFFCNWQIYFLCGIHYTQSNVKPKNFYLHFDIMLLFHYNFVVIYIVLIQLNVARITVK